MIQIKNKQDWRDLIRQIAPTIGTALGGPFAGLALQSLTQALFPGAKKTPNEETFKRVLFGGHQNLDQAMKQIKSAEKDFIVKLKQLDLDEEKLAQLDRHSARGRQEEIGDQFPNLFGGFIILGFFCTVGFVLYGGLDHIENGTLTLIGSLIGYVSAKADQVVAFFFGSSSSSREKTRALTQAFHKK